MSNRLAVVTATLAFVAAASLTLAAGLPREVHPPHATGMQAQVVQLERVVVTARRVSAESD